MKEGRIKKIFNKLNTGDQVRFKDGFISYFMKHKDDKSGWFSETASSTPSPKLYKNIMYIQGKPINEGVKKIIKEVLEDQKKEILTFEKDPIEYIVQKYPSLDATLIDLMTDIYKDYLIGIYVMAPKPTTFKILLHNGQSFYLIYNPKGYTAKVSGKNYNLMTLKETEYAIKSISRLLTKGIPSNTQGPEFESNGEIDPMNNFSSDMTSEPDLGDLGDLDDLGNNEDGDLESGFEDEQDQDKDQLQEQEIKDIKSQPKIKFRIKLSEIKINNPSIPKNQNYIDLFSKIYDEIDDADINDILIKYVPDNIWDNQYIGQIDYFEYVPDNLKRRLIHDLEKYYKENI